jgi:exodeoxyribonuclease III
MVRIASWNINSVRARAAIVDQFLTEERPDILCLQETKAADVVFPYKLFREIGYEYCVTNGQPMHHGVAIISRLPLTEDARHDWQDNGEARHVGARLSNGVRIENVYIPAGGETADREINPKFGQKMDFLERMTNWSKALRDPTILVGDFNIAPLESDVWNHRQLIDVVSHTPGEVAALEKLQASNGWVDLGRKFVPAPQRLYTWWSYRAKDYTAGDRGRRLDHMWATPEVAKVATGHRVVEHCRSWDRPSDHIPLITDFAF